jgi:hypothetical protein
LHETAKAFMIKVLAETLFVLSGANGESQKQREADLRALQSGQAGWRDTYHLQAKPQAQAAPRLIWLV